jgi:tetratricopeptide (TPR) repeat protein
VRTATCAVVLGVLVCGCRAQAPDDALDLASISRNGLLAGGLDSAAVHGRTLTLAGFVDARNLYGDDAARRVLGDWWSGPGPGVGAWRREALAAFERYVGSMPDDANALFYAALAANALRNREQALAHLDRLADLQGASTRQLWLRAQTLMAVREHAAAARVLADAAGPDAPVELIVARQQALFRAGQRDTALSLIEQARAAQPQARVLKVAEAKLRFAAGEPEAAEAIADALLAQEPNDVDALLILGEAALLRGEADLLLAVRLRDAARRARRRRGRCCGG